MHYYIIGLTTGGDDAPVYVITDTDVAAGENPHAEFARFFERHRYIDTARVVDGSGNALYQGEAGEGGMSAASYPVTDAGVRLDWNPRTGKARLRTVGELVDLYDGPELLGQFVALPPENGGRQYGAWVRRTR